MPIFITQGKYTSDAIKGMLAKPEDRTEEVAKLLSAGGGKLISYYNTTGDYDFLTISEGPTAQDAISTLLVAAASGTVTDLKTVTAISGADMKQCLQKAASLGSKFRPAGR